MAVPAIAPAVKVALVKIEHLPTQDELFVKISVPLRNHPLNSPSPSPTALLRTIRITRTWHQTSQLCRATNAQNGTHPLFSRREATSSDPTNESQNIQTSLPRERAPCLPTMHTAKGYSDPFLKQNYILGQNPRPLGGKACQLSQALCATTA